MRGVERRSRPEELVALVFVLGPVVLGLPGCHAPPPGGPPRGGAVVLDARRFASDVVFLPAGQLGCALLEQGEHRLVSFARDGGRRLWQLRLGEGQGHLSQLAVSPSGKLLAAAFRELHETGPPGGPSSLVPAGSVLVVDLRGGRVLRRVPVPRPVLAVAFVDEERLAIGTAAVYRRADDHQMRPLADSAGVCLFGVDGRWIGCRSEHSDSVTSLAVLEGGVLASGSWDGTVRLWGPGLVPLERLSVGAAVNALASAPRAPGGPLLAVATSREPPRRSQALTDLERQGGHRGAAHDADRVELWRLSSRSRVRVLRPHRFYVTELASSADGSLIASGSWDFTVEVRRDGEPPLRLERFSHIITGLAVSPEADALAVSAWTDQGSGAPSCMLLPLPPR